MTLDDERKEYDDPEFKWNNSYIGGLLILAGVLFAIFYNEDKITLPLYATLLVGAGVSIAFGAMWWDSLKMKGTVIVTELGATGFLPSQDYKYMSSARETELCLAPKALGGFIAVGFAQNGNEDFLLTPPEFTIKIHDHYADITTLRDVPYEELKRFYQERLKRLPRFSHKLTDKRKNIHWGDTTQFFNQFTNKKIVEQDISFKENRTTNTYSHYIDDLSDTKAKVFSAQRGKVIDKITNTGEDD